jgi:hypothetical protein
VALAPLLQHFPTVRALTALTLTAPQRAIDRLKEEVLILETMPKPEAFRPKAPGAKRLTNEWGSMEKAGMQGKMQGKKNEAVAERARIEGNKATALEKKQKDKEVKLSKAAIRVEAKKVKDKKLAAAQKAKDAKKQAKEAEKQAAEEAKVRCPSARSPGALPCARALAGVRRRMTPPCCSVWLLSSPSPT